MVKVAVYSEDNAAPLEMHKASDAPASSLAPWIQPITVWRLI